MQLEGYDLHNGITPVMEMMINHHHHYNNKCYLILKSTAVSEKLTVVQLTVEFLIFMEPHGLLVIKVSKGTQQQNQPSAS
jgi:hypothetical protein